MIKPNLIEARKLARDYKTIPVSRTRLADVRTPIAL
jgi:hypothetical protein